MKSRVTVPEADLNVVSSVRHQARSNRNISDLSDRALSSSTSTTVFYNFMINMQRQ